MPVPMSSPSYTYVHGHALIRYTCQPVRHDQQRPATLDSWPVPQRHAFNSVGEALVASWLLLTSKVPSVARPTELSR